MSTLTAYHTLNTQAQLDLMRLQLQWLEREIALLQQTLPAPTNPSTLRTFQSLRGVWAGITVSDDDFRAARLTLPDNLL